MAPKELPPDFYEITDAEIKDIDKEQAEYIRYLIQDIIELENNKKDYAGYNIDLELKYKEISITIKNKPRLKKKVKNMLYNIYNSATLTYINFNTFWILKNILFKLFW